MKFSTFAILATGASAAVVNSWSASATETEEVHYTTEVVTKLTTYCPEPTKITHAGKTYTVTEATTLTITDCPCTVSKPVWTSSKEWKPESTWKAESSSKEWKAESTWKAESSKEWKPEATWAAESSKEWKSEATWAAESSKEWKPESTWAAEYPKTTPYEAPKTTSVWKYENATSTSELVKFTGAANAINVAGAGVVGVAALFAAVL